MGGAASPMRTALAFLTIVPTGRAAEASAGDLARSAMAFPLVGLCIGGLLAGFSTLGRLAGIPEAIADLVLVGILAFLTGGLHLDGLADAADGLGGGWDRDRVLEIMRDSRIGTFGAVALVIVLLGKYEALRTLSAPVKPWMLLLFPVLGRWAAVQVAYLSPYVGRPEGTGRAITEQVGGSELFWALATTLPAAVLLRGWRGLILLVACSAATWRFARYCRRRLGGITGDIIGAAVEGNEVLALALAASGI